MTDTEKQLLADISTKNEAYIDDWIIGLLEEYPIKPMIHSMAVGEDKLLFISKLWVKAITDDPSLGNALNTFRERIFYVFKKLSSQSNNNQNSNHKLSIEDIPTQLNRLIYFFNYAPDYFKDEYKIPMGALLTVKNSILNKWIYGENRSIYIALLDVFIRWHANGLDSQPIQGYHSTFRNFLFEKIDEMEDSGYCQVALKYFIFYRFENEYFVFLNKSFKYFNTEIGYVRLIDSLKLLYGYRKEGSIIELALWIQQSPIMEESLVNKILRWLNDISNEKNCDLIELTKITLQNDLEKLPKFGQKLPALLVKYEKVELIYANQIVKWCYQNYFLDDDTNFDLQADGYYTFINMVETAFIIINGRDVKPYFGEIWSKVQIEKPIEINDRSLKVDYAQEVLIESYYSSHYR